MAHVDAEGIYVAYGKSVYRYNSDGSGQTHLLNTENIVQALHTDGDLLSINHSSGLYANFVSINKSTNTIVDTFTNYIDSVYGSSISPEFNRIVGSRSGISPDDVTYAAYDDAGNFTGGGDSPYHGDYPGSSQTWMFPGGTRFVDNSGTIYSTDSLSWLNSIPSTVTDIAFVGGSVPVVLSGTTVTAYSAGLLPTGDASLDHSPEEIFVNDTNVITFTPDGTSGTGWTARLVALSDLNAPDPGAPVDPAGLAYTPDGIEVAADGTVLLFSKAHQSIFQWNPLTHNYGETISLVGSPTHMAYSSTTDTVYLAYNSGLIQQIDLGAADPAETPFATTAGVPLGLSTAGPYLFVADSSQNISHHTYAPDGTLVDTATGNRNSEEFVWSDATQKMYFFRSGISPNDLHWEQINADGSTYPGEPAGGIGQRMDSPLHTSSGFTYPIHVSPDGSIVVLGSGVIHDATTLARLPHNVPNSFSDAAWLGDKFYTIRNISGVSQVQHWSSTTFGQLNIRQLPQSAEFLISLSSTELLAVTMTDEGVPTFQVLDENLADVDPLISTAVIFVNDDFTQPGGTIIADADLNTPGDQFAIIGLNAFATLQEGIDAVQVGGIVSITDDLATDGPGTYSENLQISGDLTIRSSEADASAVVIDGGAAGSVVSISAELVSLQHVTIQNGSATQGGGIVNSGGVLTIQDVVLQNNSATGDGGGLYNTGDGRVFLTRTQVTGNSAGAAGGGVANNGVTVTLSDVLIEANTAGVNGGGLHNSGAAQTYVGDASIVAGNGAGEEGGGIWNSSVGLVIVRGASAVQNNVASGNGSDQGGGGIFNDGGRLAIQAGTVINGNSADGAAGSGGGVFSANGIVTIDGSEIVNNTATRAGGGIEFVTGTLEVTNSQVHDNAATGGGAQAPGDGGGIHVTGRSGQVGYIRLVGGSVNGNTAARQGGGVWHQHSNIMVVRGGAVLDGNTASGESAGDGGGGIFNNGGRLSVGEGAVISNNAADGDAAGGGGIYSTRSAVSIAGGTVISGNFAGRAGGGIEVIHGLVTITDSTIENNEAGTTGAPNRGYGGGVHITGTSFTRVDLWNSIVRNNTAAKQGGGLWNQANGVMLVRVGSQIIGNTASGDAADDGGGGIYNQGGRLIINNATIDGNSADGTAGSGGGVFTRDWVVTVENATISNNTAHRAGGGVEIIDGWFYTRNMDLVGNNAGGTAPDPGDGGGLHVTGTNLSRVRIDGGTIADNTASGSGGGLWHQAGSLMVIFGGTTIDGNTAAGDAAGAGGGGIFNAGGRLAITEATLSGNSASGTNGAGGGILSLGGGLTLDNSTVSGNSANGDGGGIVSNGDLIAANATIVGNRSDADGAGGGSGGGVFNGGLATLNNTIVAGNLVGAGSAASDLAGNALRPASSHNIVGDAASAGGLVDGTNGNIVGNAGVGVLALPSIIDPTLANNGGPTLTHALAQNSPAIDAGSNSLAEDVAGMAFTTDQRGIGFPRIVNETVDIGAVEGT